MPRSHPIVSSLSVNVRHALHHKWPAGQEIRGKVSGNTMLWLVTRGRVTVASDQAAWQLDAGTAFLFNIEGERRVTANETTHWLSVGMSASLYDERDLWHHLPTPSLWHPGDDDFRSLRECCLGICREWAGRSYKAVDADTFPPYLAELWSGTEASDPVASLICDGHARALFALCFRATGGGDLDADFPAWLPVALQALNARPDLGVDELARQIGVSRRHLARLVQNRFGLAPKEYIAQRRLHHARQLLVNTALSPSQIAARSGFSDDAHFRRAFKARYGHSPLAYRQETAASFDMI